jgi:hypothetical protein
MNRIVASCLVPATLLGILLTPVAAFGLTMNIGTGDLVDDGYTEFEVSISSFDSASTITDVKLSINNLIEPETPAGEEFTDYLNDVGAYLIFNGQSLRLFQGLTGNSLSQTTLADTGVDPIDVGSAPYNGTFRAQGGGLVPGTTTINTFAGFNGINGNGTWRLRISDSLKDDYAGFFDGGTLTVESNSPSTSVPVPPQFIATAIAGGLGLLSKRRQPKQQTA